jgi:hypothetical protein
MITLVDIEAAIQKLPESDIRQLSGWLQSYMEEMWDRQIEADLVSGKLVQAGRSSVAVKSVGSCSPRNLLPG